MVRKETSDEPLLHHCRECAAEVQHIDLHIAVEVSGLRSRMILLMLLSGKIHSFESADGQLMICYRSLMANSKPGRGDYNEEELESLRG